MLTLTFDGGGAEQSLDVLVDSLSDLKPVFARFTKYMRGEVDETFKSHDDGAWPELSDASKARQKEQAPESAERIKAQQYGTLRSRLRGERLKAQKLLARTPSGSKLGERRQKALAKKEALQAEFERVAAGGERSTDKAYRKLGERIARREQRANELIVRIKDGDAPLGRIAQSISVQFDGHQWVMYSRIPWAGAHNEGAKVGRGNKTTLPKRTFLEWTPERVAKFAEIAADYVAEKFEKAQSKGESK